MSKVLTVTGTGDSLFTARFPKEYAPMLQKVAEIIGSCDVKLTNLETNLSDFDSYASAYSGGTWLNTKSEYAEDLFRFGFNYCGTANNHCMDYSYGGLLSTLAVLDRYGMPHSGTGKSLEEAAAPAVLNVKGERIAVFAVDASFEDASRAGRATHDIKARPGVNFLRHNTAYHITKEQELQLRAIAKDTRINYTREMSIATGFLPVDPEGFFFLDKLKFTTRDDVPETSCNEKDKTRILDAVRKAKAENDYVFLLIHCHNNDGRCHENPPEYLKEFSHACAEAGVSAIFGGGCHSLRPVEIYQNVPIFYSLGDFIYQGLTVEYLPADFMEKFNADINLSAYDALMKRARGGKVGLHCHKKNYQTVLPQIEFTDGRMTKLELVPVHLNFEHKDLLNGLPAVAEGREAQEIYEVLRDLSKPYGVTFTMENGKIVPDHL